jgi:hypothetical protein
MYQGAQFRSRLEAHWAAFFDLVGWHWLYEPIDADGYIPDFLVEGEWPFFVEVGACLTTAEYADKATKADLNAGVLQRDVLVLGMSSTPRLVSTSVGELPHHFAAGLLGEHQGAWEDEPESFVWDAGFWGECYLCRAVGVIHSQMTYTLRPCGHHQSGSFGAPLSADWIDALWRNAGNRVQWLANRPQPLRDVPLSDFPRIVR